MPTVDQVPCWTLVLLHSNFRTILVGGGVTPICVYPWENWSSERVFNLPKVTQVVRARVKFDIPICLWSVSLISVLQVVGLHRVLTQKAPSIVLGPKVIEKQKACFPKIIKKLLLIKDPMQSSRVNTKGMVAFMETVKTTYWYLTWCQTPLPHIREPENEPKDYPAVNNVNDNNSIDSIGNLYWLGAF